MRGQAPLNTVVHNQNCLRFLNTVQVVLSIWNPFIHSRNEGSPNARVIRLKLPLCYVMWDWGFQHKLTLCKTQSTNCPEKTEDWSSPMNDTLALMSSLDLISCSSSPCQCRSFPLSKNCFVNNHVNLCTITFSGILICQTAMKVLSTDF